MASFEGIVATQGQNSMRTACITPSLVHDTTVPSSNPVEITQFVIEVMEFIVLSVFPMQ